MNAVALFSLWMTQTSLPLPASTTHFVARAELLGGDGAVPWRGGHLAVRADLRASDLVVFGLQLGAINLPGKEGRVWLPLPLAQLELSPRAGGATDLRLPLRFGFGYLPRNGPLARVSVGFRWQRSRSWAVGADVGPTAIVTHSTVLMALHIGAELRFGGP